MTQLSHHTPQWKDEWVLCPSCGTLVYGKKLSRQLSVCPECGHHHRLTALERLAQLLDPGSVRSIVEIADGGDPLGFVDTEPYSQRLERARRQTGLDEAVMCAQGTIDGNCVVVAVMDFRFLGGSLGTAVGEAITRAAELALAERTPLVIVAASGGARMQEGALSLMQMAKTSQALGQLDEAGILTISVITDPTYGGVAASFATLCDVILAEPGARLGFAGPRVIEQTIRQRLPEGFQTAEFLFEHGLIDGICPRSELRATLSRLLAVAEGGTGRSWQPSAVEAVLTTEPSQLPDQDAWAAVRSARDLNRPTTMDYANLVLDRFVELHGDRLGEDCPALIAGVGMLEGQAIALIGHQRGHTPRELAARNFGMPTPGGYRKAARVLRLAAKLGIPVVTLIDTPGAYPGIEAEQRGQAFAVAENIRLMAGLPVPVIAVIIGEGGSGGALALAVADRVLINSGAVYSVISPEGCAAILWKDAAAAPVAAAALGLGAKQLLRLGVVDGVVPEPPGGSQADHWMAADRLRIVLKGLLAELSLIHPAELVAGRRRRFRDLGRTAEPTSVGAAKEKR
ncbi:acetyl-CoA carboxylase carboxyltransferase subunit beta [Planosporangium thailandense]|uniref:Multifunctional fusion protein n=1 Tax=Planosporangium thailandense TaxID=765197 RepID=A0ABX0XVS4_9ACTN|nr:acetyl-CoA carboxylase, carboxyltransferase subunit beta [Planosporangium thailandense]NJC69926.1 acetyl-CoA carboxylase carboxyltransferase subunit beta [Planosporangium thailandense]